VEDVKRGAARRVAPARPGAAPAATVRRGIRSGGRIVSLQVGQGHGFIRLADHRDVFFHRSDVRDGNSFNDFAVGDAVLFELYDDAVSGPRALDVQRRRARQ
jgi:cold shock CspA family protein